MTRRRAAAVVIALLVAGVAWWLVSTSSETATSETTPTPDAASIEVPAVMPPTPEAATKDRVEAPRTRRRSAPTDDAAPMTLERSAKKFHGRTVFEDGRPAVGARVRVFDIPEPTDGSSQIGDEAIVGADGRFDVGAVDDDQWAVVYGVLPGFAYAGVRASTADDIVLTFVRGGVVSGTVYGADGRPMPDVEVRLVRCDQDGLIATAPSSSVWARPEVAAFNTQSTRTDRAGRFRLAGASLVFGDRHSVAVVAGPDGKSWRSDVATFDTSGAELVLDVRVGVNPLDEVDPYRRLEGVVTDADDRPIANAEVLYGVLENGAKDERRSVATDLAGRFKIQLERGFARNGRRVEVRVGRPGFWTWRGAPPNPGDAFRVRLTHWAIEPRPGRVLGVATDSSDRPLSGRLLIYVEDEFFRTDGQWAMVDEQGAFTLEGLWHGTWRISLDGGRSVEVAIRDGDEVRVRLRSKHGATLKPAPELMTKLLDVQRLRVGELEHRKAELAASGRPQDAVDAELSGAIDDLKRAEATAKRVDALPRREVLVTGVPRDGSYVVGAKRDGAAWRVEARDGVARFPSLSTETWAFTIERFGIGTAPRDVDIVEGDGPQTVEVSLPR